jgi:hypothetical protein
MAIGPDLGLWPKNKSQTLDFGHNETLAILNAVLKTKYLEF